MNHVLRYNTLHHILVQITDSASAKLIRDINSINEENKILTSEGLNGFLYKGKHYGGVRGAIKKITKLDPSLYDRMEAYLKEKADLDTDYAWIKNYLSAVLTQVEPPHWYQFIPPSLHPIIKKMGIQQSPELIPQPEVVTLNQKGYDILLQRILLQTIGC